jgi:hypothetical protein
VRVPPHCACSPRRFGMFYTAIVVSQFVGLTEGASRKRT